MTHNDPGETLAAVVQDVRDGYGDQTPDARPCEAMLRRATYYDPPEYCDEDAAEDSDFCPRHDPDAEDPRIGRAGMFRART
jgi:hypothetical protein